MRFFRLSDDAYEGLLLFNIPISMEDTPRRSIGPHRQKRRLMARKYQSGSEQGIGKFAPEQHH